MATTPHGCSSYRGLSGLDRRQALRLGMLGGLGLSLPGLLESEAHAREKSPAKAKSVILLWLQGGVSHHDTFDPKPTAPAEIRGEFATIPTKVPGVLFSDKVPLLAGMLDQFALIRSVTHREAAHERGSMYMVEGRRPAGERGTGPSGNPQLGCMVAQQLGARDGVPAFVSNPGTDFTTKFIGHGWLPRATQPFRGVDVGILRAGSDTTGDYLQQRTALLQRLDAASTGRGDAWNRFQTEAAGIISSGKVVRAFDLAQESEATRQLYGIGKKTTDKLGELTLTARRLVEAGVRFVTVGRDSWDHHSTIFPQLKGRLPVFDAAFSGLITDLKQRGLFDETLVVYLTEYGRTPKVNKDAGRDHWPQAFSVAFAGAGIRPGQVIGATDPHGAEVKDAPVTPEQIAATILHLVGIDPHTMVDRVDGRPNALIENGDPIRALLS